MASPLAADLMFGVSSGQGGFHCYISRSRNGLVIDEVFAGLPVALAHPLAVKKA